MNRKRHSRKRETPDNANAKCLHCRQSVKWRDDYISKTPSSTFEIPDFESLNVPRESNSDIISLWQYMGKDNMFGFDGDCDFKATMRVNSGGQVITGDYSCSKAHPPELSPADRTALDKGLHGEIVDVVTTKRCLCGTYRFAVHVEPTDEGGAEISIKVIERVWSSNIIEFRKD